MIFRSTTYSYASSLRYIGLTAEVTYDGLVVSRPNPDLLDAAIAETEKRATAEFAALEELRIVPGFVKTETKIDHASAEFADALANNIFATSDQISRVRLLMAGSFVYARVYDFERANVKEINKEVTDD